MSVAQLGFSFTIFEPNDLFCVLSYFPNAFFNFHFMIATYVESLRTSALYHVSEIEEIAVEGSGPAFRIPRRYNRYVFFFDIIT